MLRRLYRAIGSQRIFHLDLVVPANQELELEEIRKRSLFAALLIPGIIVLFTFGVYHLTQHNWLEGLLDLATGVWLIGSLLAMRKMASGLVIYRVNTFLIGLLFLFLAAKGGIEGNKILWLFSFPLIAFYTLGMKEGLLWTLVIFFLNLTFIFMPGSVPWIHAYSLEFKIRFCAAFILVGSMTYIYESVRRKTQESLEAEKRKLASMAGTVQDANRALEQSEQRLKQAQSIARVGNFEYDVANQRLWASEEALLILDLNQGEESTALSDVAGRIPEFSAFLSNHHAPNRYEFQFTVEPAHPLNEQDTQRMVLAKTECVFSFDGRPEKVIGVIQDITAQYKAELDKKELEERLVRSQKMEALGLLAGGVAHDLNNVLSGIVSYPDMMLMNLPADSDLRKPLLTMRDSGQKAAAIVQDLLTLARRGVTSLEILNLNDLIDQYLQSPEFEKLSFFHPEAEIAVSKQKDLLNIKGSALHLVKALMNLVSNGIEALKDAGKVEISTRNRYIDRPLRGYSNIQEGEYVILSVADNGGGIPPDDLSRIFEPFYTKKNPGRSGTGLGLAVVWGTIEDHHGYINVTSEVGKGTLVELYLPATRELLVRQDREVLPADYRGKGESVLIVDDVAAQRRITSEMLVTLGYRVETAASGEDAITILQEKDMDLVILDMIMDPGMDGLETYIRLQELKPEQKTLIVSGFSESGRVKKAQKLGAGAYIKKPFSIETIGLALHRELYQSGKPADCAH